MDAGELHRQVEDAFNRADVEGLVALYEPDATMVRDDGSVVTGIEAIREIWSGFVALGGRIRMTTRFVVQHDDIAMLSNSWTFEGAGLTFSAITAEVARRSTEGAWRYVIDNPFGLTDA